jgi:uncharacterized protein YjiS (DUF1127 family)
MISSRHEYSPGKHRLAGLLLHAWWFMRRPVLAAARYRRRRAQSHALRHLSDYQLKDIGLFRHQVGTGLADEAGRARSRRQQINWMHSRPAEEGDGCAGK